MPITDHYPIPPSTQDLPVPIDSSAPLFLCFIAGTDPATNASWCPDVRAALPKLQRVFESETAPKLLYVHVGQKPEWKDQGNVYRTQWGVKAVPQLVKFQRIGGEVKVVGQLVENEVLDEEKLGAFVSA
ncbi:hypothetical protein E8E13_007430 [Curvularia kusanoi]|uniref:Thioredoxin domain-containing protein n=1 Tax=Curvularia kusanoi TaxID=90978 RepID=A0A9P4T9T7_CURKU|nr:hypothetical protein E8E13_007430 [Curvularia kusanoi]